MNVDYYIEEMEMTDATSYIEVKALRMHERKA